MARKIEVVVTGDTKGLEKAFGKASNSASGFGKAMGKAGKFAAVGLAGLGAGAAVAGKRMIDLASDAAEVQSKMEVVFGKALPGLTKNLDKFSEATGTSKFALREQAADMGALLKPLVGTREKAADMSAQFVKLATDLGSFNNVPTADALLAIRSGLVGEAEPLRRFGVLLNEAAVKQEALRLGLVKGREELTEQEKVQARASLIMQQTSLAQGDATRTAGSMANQMKALRANVEDAATSIGMALLPHALSAVRAFNEHWPTIQRVAGQVFGTVGRIIEGLKPTFAALVASIRLIANVAEDVWPRVQAAAARVVAWYRGTLQPAIQNVLAALRAFWDRFGDDITKMTQTAFNTIRAVVVSVMRIIQGVIEGVLAVIRGDWTQAWNSLKQVVSNTIKGVMAILQGLSGLVFQAMVAVGRAIIDGVIAGASGLGSRLGSALKGQIQGAIDGVKGFFGISSPSKVAAEQIGKPLAEGVVQGLDGGLALLLPKMQARIKAATDRIESQVKAARDRMSTAFGSLSDKMLRAFDAETGGTLTPAEQKIAAINARRRIDELNRSLESAQASGDAEAIARAQEDIHLHSLEEQAANERKAYEDRRSFQREQLEQRLATLGAHFEKEGATVEKAMLKINQIMRAFGITFEESGALIGSHFVRGLQTAIGGAAAGAGGVRGSLTGGNATPQPITFVAQLDGETVWQSTQKYMLRDVARGSSIPV